jgi:hypothetical protein
VFDQNLTLRAAVYVGIVTEWPLVSQITVLIGTTDDLNSKESKTFHQNVKNHSSQLILFLYNQYYWLMARTSLEPSTSLIVILIHS